MWVPPLAYGYTAKVALRQEKVSHGGQLCRRTS